MRTYSIIEEDGGRCVGFQIENVYISLSKVAQILSGIDGVTNLKRRRLFSKWDGTHIWFRYNNSECIVWEPFGDSSRYWIGQIVSPNVVDITNIETAFNNYRLPLHRKLLGDIVSLRFIRWFFIRDKD